MVTSRHPLQKKTYYISVDRWVSDVLDGLKFENNKKVYTLKYEDLISEFDITIEKLMSFLDEKYTVEVKNFVNYTNVQNNRAWDRNVQDIHTNSLKKWEHPEHRSRLEEFYNNKTAVQLLERLGYKL